MRKDIAQLWCRALRSHEFVQGKGFLDKEGKYCPLGILTALAMLEGVCDVTETKKGYAYDKELGRVPVSVQHWAQLHGQNGEIRGEFVNLTAYNDIYGYTLPELAIVIEENYERL